MLWPLLAATAADDVGRGPSCSVAGDDAVAQRHLTAEIPPPPRPRALPLTVLLVSVTRRAVDPAARRVVARVLCR